ncbi:MAG: phosphoribosyltransferase family protein [Culicoidibacterales bacterium]
MIHFDYSSKRGAGDDKNHSNQLPILDPSYKRVLIIDDIVDTGNSLLELRDHFSSAACTVLTAAIHFKENAVITPDLYYWRIPSDSVFITYPYEQG